jgi:Pentapeptide repeats (8 copies)
MPDEHDDPTAFRGAQFTGVDFTGATFRECDLRVCALSPAPGYPDESRTVGRYLRVVMKEECEHRRDAVRDLAVLEERI